MTSLAQCGSRVQVGHIRALLSFELTDRGIASGVSHRFFDALMRWRLIENHKLTTKGVSFLAMLRADATWSVRIDSMIAARMAERETV